MQILVADDLVLEPLIATHAEDMFEVLGDREIYRYLDYGPPASADALRVRYIRLASRHSPDGTQQWLNWVIRAGNAGLIGYVQATLMSPHTAWLGYIVASPHWGRGHAFKAVNAMVAHLETQYQVDRCLATVEVENLRSVRLLQRLGFRLASEEETSSHSLTPTERLFLRERA